MKRIDKTVDTFGKKLWKLAAYGVIRSPVDLDFQVARSGLDKKQVRETSHYKATYALLTLRF